MKHSNLDHDWKIEARYWDTRLGKTLRKLNPNWSVKDHSEKDNGFVDTKEYVEDV